MRSQKIGNGVRARYGNGLNLQSILEPNENKEADRNMNISTNGSVEATGGSIEGKESNSVAVSLLNDIKEPKQYNKKKRNNIVLEL